MPRIILRERDLTKYDGLRRTQRAKLVTEGTYPHPARAQDNGRAKLFFMDEVEAWQRWRLAKRDGTAKDGSSWRDYLIEPTSESTT